MLALLLAVALAASPAPAAPAETVANARELLAGIDMAPPVEALRLLGPDAAAALVTIAGDATVPVVVRARAVWSLGGVPTDAGRAALDALLADATAPAMLRRAAPWALITGWGDAAVPVLTTALAGGAPDLRAETARALARSGTDAARQALLARRDVETEPMVREVIVAALAGGAR